MPSSPSPPPTEKRRCTRERLPFRVWCDAASFLRPRELGRLERCHRAFATVSNAVGRDAFLARMAGFGFHPRQAADFYAASRRRCGVVRRRGVGPALHMAVWLPALDHYAALRESSKWVDRYFRGRRGWELVVVLAERFSHASDRELHVHRATLGAILGIADGRDARGWDEFLECYTEITHAYAPATRMLLDVTASLVASAPPRSEAVSLAIDHLLGGRLNDEERARVEAWRRSPAYYA